MLGWDWNAIGVIVQGVAAFGTLGALVVFYFQLRVARQQQRSDRESNQEQLRVMQEQLRVSQKGQLGWDRFTTGIPVGAALGLVVYGVLELGQWRRRRSRKRR